MIKVTEFENTFWHLNAYTCLKIVKLRTAFGLVLKTQTVKSPLNGRNKPNQDHFQKLGEKRWHTNQFQIYCLFITQYIISPSHRKYIGPNGQAQNGKTFQTDWSKLVFFPSLLVNWHLSVTQLLENNKLRILFCESVLIVCPHVNECVCVCVEGFVSWEELFIKVVQWRRAFPFPLLSWWEFAPKLSHTWQELTLITDCVIVFTHTSESCRSPSMPLWCVSLLRRDVDVCAFYNKGKRQRNMFGNKEASSTPSHISLRRHCNPLYSKYSLNQRTFKK